MQNFVHKILYFQPRLNFILLGPIKLLFLQHKQHYGSYNTIFH